MKSFANIRASAVKKIVQEDADSIGFARSGPLGSDNAVDTPDIAIWDITNNESISRINAYLGQANAKPTFDPASIVRQVQRKLAILGLQFIIPSGMLMQGSTNGVRQGFPQNSIGTKKDWVDSFPLTYLGGRFGVLDNNHNIGTDDNISHRRPGGLSLRVKYKVVEDSGMTLVTPQIVPTSPAGQ